MFLYLYFVVNTQNMSHVFVKVDWVDYLQFNNMEIPVFYNLIILDAYVINTEY